MHLTRRGFVAGAAVSVASLGLYAGELERHSLFTVHKTIRIARLPTAFHGFTIAQLSDFHYRKFDEPRFVQHAVAQVNRLNPNMVALTGDYITSDERSEHNNAHNTEECAAILSGIQCPLRFSTLGNHDSNDAPATVATLRRHGLNPLFNQHQAIDLGGDRLWVAGMADAYFDIPNLPATMPVRKPDEPLILLGHEPDFADTVARYQEVDLMLAGHTHGGQVRLPFLPAMFLPGLGIKYVDGLFQIGKGMQLYVNRGVGTVHLPFRFNCPPELTLLTLQPA